MKLKQLEKTGLITIHIIATFMIVIFSGCAHVHVDNLPIKIWDTIPVSATKYFPYSLDSSWVYEDQDGNEFIRRVVEEEINGKIYHAFSYEPELEDETDCPFIYPSLFHVTDGGNIVLLVGDVIEASIHIRLLQEMAVFTSDPEVVGSAVAALTEDPIDVLGNFELLFLPDKLGVDTPWKVNKIEAKIEDTNNPFDEEASFSFTITETGHVLGTETIKTPAGTFKDCLKVEYRTETKATITPAPPPEEVEPPGETITTVWFARDIGIVKYHQKSDPIFLSMIPANALELDIATLLPPMERTLELKEVDIK